ncbi:MAG: hypothetical protein OXF62_00865 [Caldilineaceae bacterium]|nr:hypothetical protein [Caldilineaceae bacterium]
MFTLVARRNSRRRSQSAARAVSGLQGAERSDGGPPEQPCPDAAACRGKRGAVTGLNSLQRAGQRLPDPCVGGRCSRDQERSQAGSVVLGCGLDVGNGLGGQFSPLRLRGALGRKERSLGLKGQAAQILGQLPQGKLLCILQGSRGCGGQFALLRRLRACR